MNTDDFEQKQFHLSVTAGMNQRYHQNRATFWSRFDRSCKIAVGASAVAGAALTGVALNAPPNHWSISASVGVAIAAAVLSVVLNVVPLSDWTMIHLDLHRRWSDFREDVDSLEFEMSVPPTSDDWERLQSLASKLHRICSLEPAPWKNALQIAYSDEILARQFSDSVSGTTPEKHVAASVTSATAS